MTLSASKLDQRLQEIFLPLPALVIGMLLLRIPEFLEALQLGLPAATTLQNMLLNDGLALLKGIPVWCLLVLPLLSLKNKQHRMLAQGLLGSAVLAAEAALIHYFEVAGVPLGADLFAYSFQEILTIADGSARPWPFAVLGALFFGLVVLWRSIHVTLRRPRQGLPRGWSLAVLCLSLVSTPVLPTQLSSGGAAETYRQHQKLSFFLSDVMDNAIATLMQGDSGIYANEFPFAHGESTPDTLGPLFNLKDNAPPHMVIIVVEGLGRSFSGPQASLGSFTPFLDSLADKSLYWENFLAAQGRTFAVLHSVLGSLPFGPYGEKRIAHDSMLSVLKSEAYDLRYFSSSNLEFDSQGAYLASEGVSHLVSEKDYVNGEKRATEWGYADAELFSKVAESMKQQHAKPTLSIVQTMSMHTPFEFPGMAAYRLQVEDRLTALKISPEKKAEYLKYRDVYASILYTDDALRKFFEKLEKTPDWHNTIVMITGDHRLPEIPMATRLERYHVPFVMASPLLRAPQSMKSVSSHFDITPSVLAMLSHRYGFKTPSTVSWMGSGLDVQVPFRNVHRLPLKQTKTELSDFVSGEYYLAQDRLFRIGDGLQPEPVQNPDILNQLKAEFGKFRASLLALNKAERLTPAAGANELHSFVAAQRALEPNGPIQHFKGLEVTGAQGVLQADGMLQVTAVLKHHGKTKSDVFVPLVVLTDTLGQELGEVSGKAIQLEPGQSQNINLSLKLAPARLVNGHYFISVIVSHPDTGKPIGMGQYHVGVQN
jgi:phosphoglycerol transferase MdoB-like AlkP superfamily enzyme